MAAALGGTKVRGFKLAPLSGAVLGLLLVAGPLALEDMAAPSGASPPTAAAADARAPHRGLQIPPSFLENVGQLGDPDVRYATTGAGLAVGFVRGGVYFAVGPPEAPASVRLEFAGAAPVEPKGLRALPFSTSFFPGRDPALWHSGVRSFEQVMYAGIYPGIDLTYSAGSTGPKYEFVVHPGADPASIQLEWSGADGLEVEAAGALLVRTPAGDPHDSPPVAWQADGEGVACSFVLRGALTAGFACHGWDGRGALVIDPVVYSSLLFDADWLRDVAVAPDGSAVAVGLSLGRVFSPTPGAVNFSVQSNLNALVARLSPDGDNLTYAAFIGSDDYWFCCKSVLIDPSGNIIIGGTADTDHFPVTANAFSPSPAGDQDCVVVVLNETAQRVLYSTFYGGSGQDSCESIALGPDQTVYIAGTTDSSDLPTRNATSTARRATDAFVARLNWSSGALEFATYLGGAGSDSGAAVKVAADGSVIVAGSTGSADFPGLRGNFGSGAGLSQDAFVARFAPGGANLSSSTTVGGGAQDLVRAIEIAADGGVLVVGTTWSSDFPTTPLAALATLGGPGTSDGFVFKVSAAGDALLFSTYVGGSGEDNFADATLAAGGKLVAVGTTSSHDFVITPDASPRSFETTYIANPQQKIDFVGIVTAFDEQSGELLHSSFMAGGAGSGWAVADGVATGPSGDVYLTGQSTTDLPGALLVGGPSPGVWGLWGFVQRINLTDSFSRSLRLIINGPQLLVDGLPLNGTLLDHCEARALSVDSPQVEGRKRYVFDRWSDGGPRNRTSAGCASLVAVFHFEFYLEVQSDKGAVGPSGWHQANASAALSVQSTTLLLGGQPWTFDGWQGDFNTTNANATLTMDGPKVVVARWVALAAPPPAGFDLFGLGLFFVIMIGAAFATTPRGKEWFAGFLLLPLFTRLKRDDVRNQYHRGRMIQYIDDNPGANISQIRKRLEISHGSCAYHLRVLERSGEVRRVVQGPFVRYYRAGYKLDAEALPPLSYVQRQILSVIAAGEGATFAEILRKLEARAVSITDKNLSYHLRVLSREKELVQVRWEGRRADYFVEPTERARLARRLKEEEGVDEAMQAQAVGALVGSATPTANLIVEPPPGAPLEPADEHDQKRPADQARP